MSVEVGSISVRIQVDDKASKELTRLAKAKQNLQGRIKGLLSSIPAVNLAMRVTKMITKENILNFLKFAKSLLIATFNMIKLGIATMVALWPIVLIVAAVMAAIMLLIIVYQNWAGIADWLSEKWSQFIEFFQNIWNALVAFGQTLWTAFSEFWTAIWTGIMTIATNVWNLLSGAWTVLITGIQKAGEAGLQFLWKIWKWIIYNIYFRVITFVHGILGLWGTLLEKARSIWTTIKTTIYNAVKWVVDTVMGLFQKMFDFIKDIPLIGDIVTAIVDAFTAAGISLPTFQFGTRYVMETGPALLHRGEVVVPRHAAPYTRARSMVNNFEIHVHAGSISSKLDLDEVGRRIGESSARELERLGF